MDTPELLIVGGGIAGAAAALRAGQYHLKTTWITGDRKTRKRSRAEYVLNVDNMIGVHPDLVLDQLPGWPEGERPHLHIGTKAIIENVHKRLKAYDAFVTLIEGAATEARAVDGGFEVMIGEQTHRAQNLLLATGVMDRQPIIAKEKGGKVRAMPNWIYPFANNETVLYCIRCEGHLTRKTPTAVIGHGEGASQIALMLAERYGSASEIFTNGLPSEASADTRKLLAHHQIEIHEEAIADLQASPTGGKGILAAIVLADGSRHEVAHAFVALGLHRVYNDLAVQLGAELLNPDRPQDERHVRIDWRGESSVRGVFAIGDMALRPDEPVMKQIYTCQEYAVRAVDTIDRRRRSRERKRILAGG